MRTSERLRKLRDWLQRELCDGRIMKAPAPDFDIMQIVRQEPKCYIGWAPTRPDETGEITYSAANVCPGISVMPRQRYAKLVEEKRFDRYNSIHRGQELGSQFPVDILFSVYEPGIRLPGFIETGDMKLLEEATETGILTLYDWMDDCVEKLLGTRMIPNTDLFVNADSITSSMYTDQSFIVDRRPVYYGFVTVNFNGYANEQNNDEIQKLLK